MAKTIQVRGVPEEVHHRLTVRAAEERRSLSELVLAELKELAARPTMNEIIERLASRPAVEARETGAKAVRAGRDERDAA